LNLRSFFSWSALLVALSLLGLIEKFEFTGSSKDISLTAAGFFLGLFGSYLIALMESYKKFATVLTGVVDSIHREDTLTLREHLSFYDDNKHTYLPEVSLARYASVSYRVLKTLTLIKKSCDSIARGKWADAKAELKEANHSMPERNDLPPFCEEPGFKSLIKTLERNSSAIKYYVDFDDKVQVYESSKGAELTNICHESINSTSKSLIMLLPASFKLIDYFNELVSKEVKSTQSSLETVITGTSILGIIGNIYGHGRTMVSTVEDVQVITDTFNALGWKHDGEISAVSVVALLEQYLSRKLRVKDLNSAIYELESLVLPFAETIRYPYHLFAHNVSLLHDRPTRDMIKSMEEFRSAGNRFREPKEIMILNIVSTIISRGLIPSDVPHAQSLHESLVHSSQDSFYYDGIRLNEVLMALYSGGDNALQNLHELCKATKNMSVMTAGLKTLLGIYARSEEKESFEIIGDELEKVYKRKGEVYGKISFAAAKEILPNPPTWHFLMLPPKQQFAEYQIAPWGEICL